MTRPSARASLIGLVLLVPAVLALHAYWTQQGSQIAFSAKERVGMVYLKPANELVVKLVEARGAAVRGDEVPALDDAIAAVDASEKTDGAALETTKLWNELKGTIAKAQGAKAGSPQAAYDAWSPAVSDALGLVVQVANGSNDGWIGFAAGGVPDLVTSFGNSLGATGAGLAFGGSGRTGSTGGANSVVAVNRWSCASTAERAW